MSKCHDKKKLKTHNKETNTVNFEVFKSKKIILQNMNLDLGVFSFVCEQGEVGTFNLFTKTRKFGYVGLIQPTLIEIIPYTLNHSSGWKQRNIEEQLSLEKIMHMGKRRWYSVDWNDVWMVNDPCYSVLLATEHGDIFEILNNPDTRTFE